MLEGLNFSLDCFLARGVNQLLDLVHEEDLHLLLTAAELLLAVLLVLCLPAVNNLLVKGSRRSKTRSIHRLDIVFRDFYRVHIVRAYL